ncbi:hypothetical protein FA13DRAFT_373613 [Coprinellus micaceus]|uniref:Uncharacterized protein n=1 Tax=Coprinellus micaceus TaxID=71717 RepID=A0A4Y7SD50_COPMI|nr:hypothetical protein FA13DRAFT_373613 [Coprinellus micaceus]
MAMRTSLKASAPELAQGCLRSRPLAIVIEASPLTQERGFGHTRIKWSKPCPQRATEAQSLNPTKFGPHSSVTQRLAPNGTQRRKEGTSTRDHGGSSSELAPTQPRGRAKTRR